MDKGTRTSLRIPLSFFENRESFQQIHPCESDPAERDAFRADAAVAAVLVKHRGMTPEQAVAEVLRLKGRS